MSILLTFPHNGTSPHASDQTGPAGSLQPGFLSPHLGRGTDVAREKARHDVWVPASVSQWACGVSFPLLLPGFSHPHQGSPTRVRPHSTSVGP